MKAGYLLIPIVFAYSAFLAAEDLGTRGQSYKLDPDAREQIKGEFAKIGQDKLENFWRDYSDKVVDAVKHPKPLPGIRTGVEPKTLYKELRYTFAKDIYGADGALLVSKGRVVEPLKMQKWGSGLMFIDGRDQIQVDYAIRTGRKTRLKIVLVAGSPYELRQRYRHEMWWGTPTIPFYFDQKGMLIKQFKRLYQVDLSQVPVLLRQEGERLRIDYGIEK